MRTGDRGAFCGATGALRILGRVDDVVNVRGVRVDARAVEAALGAGVVVVFVDGGDASRGALVAFAEPGAAPDLAAVAAAARPSEVVRLDALPRGSAGKVDRAALRRLAEAKRGLDAPARRLPGAAPPPADVSAVEAWLRELYAALAPGDGDDFLRRGGTSLAAVEAAWRVNDAFGCDAAPADVRAVADLARLVAARARGASPPAKRARAAEEPAEVPVAPVGAPAAPAAGPRARAAALAPAWALDLGRCVDASAALVAGGRAVASSHAKRTVAVDVATGAAVWEARVGDAGDQAGVLGDASTEAAALVWDDLVFVGSYDGCLYALRAATGAVAWTFAAGGPVKRAAVRCSGDVVFGSHDNRVYRVSRAGARRWASGDLGGAVYASPAVAGDVVVAATTAGALVGLDAETGHRRWARRSGAPVYGTPALADGVLYYGDVGGAARAVSAADGGGVWVFTDGARTPIYAPPLVAGAAVYFGDDRGRLARRRRGDGAKEWTAALPGKLFAAPARVAAVLVAATTGGVVVVLREDDGAPLARARLPAEVFSTPVVAGRRVLLGCRDDHLHALDLDVEYEA